MYYLFDLCIRAQQCLHDIIIVMTSLHH